MEWRDFTQRWISLDSNSSRVEIQYSTSGISSSLLDVHSKRSDHWCQYPWSKDRVKIHSIFLKSWYCLVADKSAKRKISHREQIPYKLDSSTMDLLQMDFHRYTLMDSCTCLCQKYHIDILNMLPSFDLIKVYVQLCDMIEKLCVCIFNRQINVVYKRDL